MAYFAFGLMGATATDPTELLSLVCYDKQAKTIRILEIPMDTYLGDSDLFAVKKTSEVWGNPKPRTFLQHQLCLDSGLGWIKHHIQCRALV